MLKSLAISILMWGSAVISEASLGLNNTIPAPGGPVGGMISSAMDPKILNVKILLEGAFDTGSGTMTMALYNGSVIPLTQPYGVAPWNYPGTESVLVIPPGVVDWVLVELRDAPSAAEAVSGPNLPGWPKAFFLKLDGAIVNLDGFSLPDIGSPAISNNLYIVVRHRNHLPVISSAGASLAGDVYSYDFTLGIGQAHGGAAGYKMSGLSAVMAAGDLDQDQNIFVSDFNTWAAGFGASNGYFRSDLDLDRNVFVSDFNKWASNFGRTTDVGSGGCSFTDGRDGRSYKCVTIGSQTWMAENLAWLPAVSPSSNGSESSPYYYVNGFEGTNLIAAQGTANYNMYGVLYNWEAARTACPSGWHLPTDEEWKILEKFLGMSDFEVNMDGWRFSGAVGGKLKEAGTANWTGPNTGASNSTGFRALPGGYRIHDGGFYPIGFDADFWSSTENGLLARYRIMLFYYDGVLRDATYRGFGFSVRCVQD